jgi:protein-S-isoprenylcysteine O-methyltransferase Ste14
MEEEEMITKFGDRYREYMKKVSMFFPRALSANK